LADDQRLATENRRSAHGLEGDRRFAEFELENANLQHGVQGGIGGRQSAGAANGAGRSAPSRMRLIIVNRLATQRERMSNRMWQVCRIGKAERSRKGQLSLDADCENQASRDHEA
jgi:hypothetical protein